MHRVPSVNLRLDPNLLAQVRELAGAGALTAAINEGMRLWLDHKRAPEPQPAAAAPAPAAPPSAAPASLPPPPPTAPAIMAVPMPWNAYRSPTPYRNPG